MIRAGLLALVLASPAGAEGLAGQALCAAAWANVSEGLTDLGANLAAEVTQDGDWCSMRAPVLDLEGQYTPDLHVDRLMFRGSALGWIADGSTAPEDLEIVVEGLRMVVQTGNPQMDWLFAAQARPDGIDARASLTWDAGEKVLRLEGLSMDFPGDNLLELSARVERVDLSSRGAMQMSMTGFALSEADLRITTHGLFEGYLLMPLGTAFLPYEGDMVAAADALRTDLITVVVNLPDSSFSVASKDALLALIMQLPNPSGELTMALRAAPGIGPARVAGYAATGVPDTMAETAPLFEGVSLDVDWTHTDAP